MRYFRNTQYGVRPYTCEFKDTKTMGRGSGPSSHSEIGSLALDRKYSSTVCFEIDVWDFETAGNLATAASLKEKASRRAREMAVSRYVAWGSSPSVSEPTWTPGGNRGTLSCEADENLAHRHVDMRSWGGHPCSTRKWRSGKPRR
jgi:hypothetical protein